MEPHTSQSAFQKVNWNFLVFWLSQWKWRNTAPWNPTYLEKHIGEGSLNFIMTWLSHLGFGWGGVTQLHHDLTQPFRVWVGGWGGGGVTQLHHDLTQPFRVWVGGKLSDPSPPPHPNPKWLSQVMMKLSDPSPPPHPNPKWLSQVMMKLSDPSPPPPTP